MIAVESNGQFIICDKLLEGTSKDAHLFCLRTNGGNYCSPAIWKEMINEQREAHNSYKDDAFSFGLVLLQAANQVSPQDIYEKDGSINKRNLEKRVQEATAKYSSIPLFGQILSKLLALDEKNRWDFLTLMSSMPTRQQIQYYFSNYNGDVFFEDPVLVQASKLHMEADKNKPNSEVKVTSNQNGPNFANKPVGRAAAFEFIAPQKSVNVQGA